MILEIKYWSGVLVLVLIPIFGLSQETPLNFITELPGNIDESSGLIYTPKGIFTHNDDNKPEIFRINPVSGEILQTITIQNITFDDKEAITFDGEFLYLGDFGNNDGDRRDLKVVKISFAEITDEPMLNVSGEIIAFHYPEQSSFNLKKKDNAFDCEAMISSGDHIYLFTKQRNDHQTTLYAIPKKPGYHSAQKMDVFDVNGRVSDAALSPDSKTLLLLGYQDDHQFPFLWKFSDFTRTDFFSGNHKLSLISKSELDWQTEGITFINKNDLLISSERTNEVEASLYHGSLEDLFGE
ncbi:MAG: hypothetical protein WD022_12430 [Balneolaceae bacterium]